MTGRTGLLTDWYRYVMERAVLLPAAAVAPRWVGYGIALTLAAIDLATGLGRGTRGQLRTSHGLAGVRLWHTSWRRCALPYLDLLHLARATRGWADDPGRTGVRVHISDEVRGHIRAGKPLLIVAGHFPFASSMAAVDALRRLQAEVRGDSRGPVALAIEQLRPAYEHTGGRAPRGRLVATQIQRLFQAGTGEVAPVELVEVGMAERNVATGRRLMSILKQPGALCFVAMDVRWNAASTYERPFAGWNRLPLSTGPARLAQHSGAGIALLGPTRASSFTHEVALEHVHPAAANIPADALTDVFADEIERQIGRYPADYILRIGSGRCWEHSEGRWRAAAEQRPSTPVRQPVRARAIVDEMGSQ